MTASDLQPLPALPDRARGIPWLYYGTRVALVAVLLALAAGLPRGPRVDEKYRYREGDIARERIVAPFDFRVQKDEGVLRREQQSAAAAVLPRFVMDQRVSAEALQRMSMFQEKAMAVILDTSIRQEDRLGRLKTLGVPLSDEAARALSVSSRAQVVLRELGGQLQELFTAGLVAEKRGGTLFGYRTVQVLEGDREWPRPAGQLFDRREALMRIERRARGVLGADPEGVRLMVELAGPFLQPNVVFDRDETNFRRIQAQSAISTMVGFVQKDEMIVDANQRIDRAAMLKLSSLGDTERARLNRGEAFYPPAARMLLMLLLIAAFAAYLRVELPGVYRDNAMLALFTLLTSVVMLAAEVQVRMLGLSEFTVPLALAPLVVASLLDKRPALVFTLMLAAVMVAVAELKPPFVPMAVLGGITAVYSVARLRHRWHFARAFFTIAAVNAVAILAWDMARATPPGLLAKDALWGVLNAFLSISLGFLLLPVVEMVFGLTSDVTLLELSDLNRPLLKRLQLEAPGTYHHSMVVGNLAESAAEAIGANSLLARVSAYYHDIGKLGKPKYFAENEPASTRSLHERLSPSMSALVVRSHIIEGMELARRERLPRAVQNAIPEHHGTMVMAFFYHKAAEVDPLARREDYCYPGPRPRSKETAILMLADGVEGASRALAEPTPSRIRGLVTRILDERVQEGQLDECGLTLSELARIREAFIPVLTAIFHVRVPYPEDPRRRTKSEVELRREST